MPGLPGFRDWRWHNFKNCAFIGQDLQCGRQRNLGQKSDRFGAIRRLSPKIESEQFGACYRFQPKVWPCPFQRSKRRSSPSPLGSNTGTLGVLNATTKRECACVRPGCGTFSIGFRREKYHAGASVWTCWCTHETTMPVKKCNINK